MGKTHYTSGVSNTKLSVPVSEVVAWVLMSILTVLFTGLLSVVLLWMFKKRQDRDAVKQSTDTHLDLSSSQSEVSTEGGQMKKKRMCASIVHCNIYKQ